ncbi:hypothetical protein GCM10010278_57410 [Streptomyces melanogenes]|nr:hypothetical protein GCM10010278_57410 [Streptomyces melanogenes]
MIDWDYGYVVLAKVTRRKEFTLGKSTVLKSRAVIVLDSGQIRTVVKRCDGLVVSSRLWAQSFEVAVHQAREFERAYITEELPEQILWKGKWVNH